MGNGGPCPDLSGSCALDFKMGSCNVTPSRFLTKYNIVIGAGHEALCPFHTRALSGHVAYMLSHSRSAAIE